MEPHKEYDLEFTRIPLSKEDEEYKDGKQLRRERRASERKQSKVNYHEKRR